MRIALVGLTLLACTRSNPRQAPCLEPADCPEGFCVDGQCVPVLPALDADVRPDAARGGDAAESSDGAPPDAGPQPDALVGTSCDCERLVRCAIERCDALDAPEAGELRAACREACDDALAAGIDGRPECAGLVEWLTEVSEGFAQACEGAPDGRCDATAEPTGCPPRAFCNPDDPVEDPDAPAPGSCIEGHDCVPGGEAVACEGPATCALVPPATFCLGAGEAGLGEPCTNSFQGAQTNCASGLACIYGSCHAPCDERGRCEEGRCVDYSDRLDGLPFRVCHVGCELYEQSGCRNGAACALVDYDQDGAALGVCSARPSGDGRAGDPCRQADDRYWGDCEAGYLCGQLNRLDGARCVGLCDAEDRSLCRERQVCVRGLLEPEALGICLGDCDVFADEGCAEGWVCRFWAVGEAGERGDETPAGRCAPGPVRLRTGDGCTVEPESGAHGCPAAHVCAAPRGGAATCLALCDDRHRCPRGSACARVLGDRIGYCEEEE